MSQAYHLCTNIVRRTEWFECPRCHARQEVTSQVWRSVEVLGAKPTLDVCEHQPHIPPASSTVDALERDKALVDLFVDLFVAACGGPVPKGKS